MLKWPCSRLWSHPCNKCWEVKQGEKWKEKKEKDKNVQTQKNWTKKSGEQGQRRFGYNGEGHGKVFKKKPTRTRLCLKPQTCSREESLTTPKS